MLPQQHEKITARGVRGMILNRLETGPSSWIDRIAMRMTSDQDAETYAWLGNSPAMREFLDGRSPAELSETSFVVTNKDYETSLRIKSKDMRRDKLGMINVRVNQLADRAMDHPAKLLSSLIINGESTACYDGQYFFDTDHAEGNSGTQSNDIGASATSATAPTADEIGAGVIAAIQAIYGFKDDRGEPMNQNASSFDIMVPIPFMGNALKAVTALLGTGGISATPPSLSEYFSLRVVPNPRLTWTTKMSVFRTDDAAKPFLLQEEPEGRDVIALGAGSEYEQIKKENLFGIDWTGNVAYAYWQHACLVTFS